MLKFIMLMLSTLMLLPHNFLWLYITTVLLMSSMMMSLLFSSSTMIFMSKFFSMDLMSMSLIVLTLWISAMMFLASYKIKLTKNMHKLFSMVVIMLTTILMLSFSSSNIISFYIWFEASLIPTMLLIMIWGYQPERIQASMYLMIYTVTASLPLLVIIMKMFHSSSTLMLPMSWMFNLPKDLPMYMIWMMLMSAFLVKLPLFSVHLWLPKAHVEAPIAGSMILAAILLKLGGYGLLRMTILFPQMKTLFPSYISSVALIGAILTSLICLRQSDMKSLIAYSSIGHMGILVAGSMSVSKLGLYGSLGMMIAHGLSSSAMFCMANISYELYHTRSMTLTKGSLSFLPLMSTFWFLFASANMAAPPSINLLSEIMLITATSYMSLYMTTMFMLTSFLTAAYSLFLYANINHGSLMMVANPMNNLKYSYISMLLAHLWPIIFLIIMPASVTMWC